MTSRSDDDEATRYAVGLDVGTSAVKAAVLSSDGGSFDYVSAPYATVNDGPGWAEQDPQDWWHAIGEVLDCVLDDHPGLNADVAIVGLTGQMHTTVARDRHGALVRPAILWSDERAAEVIDSLRTDSERWVARAGNLPIPAFTSAHLRWLREYEPEEFAAIARVCVPKDDIRARLGAGWATEPSDASAMNLMDLRVDAWDAELLAAVGIHEDVLAPIVPSASITGRIRSLPPLRGDRRRLLGTAVIAGAADQAAQAIALDAVAGDAIAVSVGTSGAAFQAISAPREGAFRHAVPATWLALDSTHAAGLALDWWSGVSKVAVGSSSDTAGQSDLPIFLPYLQGSRDGHGAPGTLTDLRAHHGSQDIARAVLEGVGVELIRLVRAASLGRIPDTPIGVGGRAAQLAQLRMVMATGLDRPIRYSGWGPAHGDARMAADTAGWWHRYTASAPATADSITFPDPQMAIRLLPRLARYSQLVDRLS